jgi:hypothetical protein
MNTNYYLAYRNKITNKLWGVVQLKAEGKKKGTVLLSYLVSPFIQAPGEYSTDPHSSTWECFEIARLFSIRGYDVDIINWDNTTFLPRKKYDVCVDIQKNLKRLSPLLGLHCKKVMHIVSSQIEAQHQAESERLDYLLKRRGIRLEPSRPEAFTGENAAYADFLEGFGNKSVYTTYAHYNKPIYPIPISVAFEFDFPKPKDFESAKKHFMWFGGGGAILKGLDLVLEAAAHLPKFHFHIIGPAHREKDFAALYAKEFALKNVSLYNRPRINAQKEMVVDDVPFKDLADQCAAIIYPSASEGTSGSVIQAIHAGLVPIVTERTGIHESIGIRLAEATVESVEHALQSFSSLPASEIRDLAHKAWNYVHIHHTKKAFSAAYGKFIDEVLKLV